MRPTLIALAVLAAPMAAAAPSLARAADLPILPGWWDWNSQLAVLAGKHEMRCLRPRDINKVLTGAINHHYTCQYAVASFEGGQARLQGVCVDKHGEQVPINLHGTYTQTSFSLRGSVRAKLAGLTVPVSGKIDAHRVAETCPAGAPAQSASPGG